MELIYTWSQLKAVQDHIAQIGRETDAITERRQNGEPFDEERVKYNRLWDIRHDLEEQRDIMMKQVIPEPGMPCTVKYFSDSSGGYVKEVKGKSKKTIVVQQDGVYHSIKEYTYRRNGLWVEKGTTTRDWGTLCFLGYKHDYYDMSY